MTVEELVGNMHGGADMKDHILFVIDSLGEACFILLAIVWFMPWSIWCMRKYNEQD
uniref:Uncharacterized protein n=1 Tax=viral metagenome TaxID=1070528 RepID=A0A6H2A492_9ZZZZ